MIKSFIAALKSSRVARFTLIGVVVLMIPLCILGAFLGLSPIIVIITLLAVGFPLIIAAGGFGAAVGMAGTALSNKKSISQTELDNPELAGMEKERSKLQLINVAFWVLAVAGFLIAAGTLGNIGVIVEAAAAFCVYFFLIRKRNEAFEDDFKQHIVLSSLNGAFQNVDFQPKKAFDEKEVGGVTPISFNCCRGDDWIEADRGKLHFCRADAELEIETSTVDSEGNETTSRKTVFAGTILRLTRSRPYQSPVFVASRKFKTGRICNVETESIVFDKQMEVYAEDQLAARVILTPQMMEGLLRLDEKSPQSFSLTFSGTYVYAFLRSPEGNSFEIDIKKDKTVPELKAMIDGQVSQLCVFLDSLELPEE